MDDAPATVGLVALTERRTALRVAHRSVGANFGVLVGGDLANKSLRFLAATVLAHALALDDFGRVNIGIAVSGLIVTATTLGLPDLGSRQVAVSRRSAPRLAHLVVGGRLLACFPIVAFGFVVSWIFASGSLGLVAAGGAMALLMSASADWLARGLERMTALSLAWIVGGVTVLAGALVVSAGPRTAPTALAAFAVGEAAIAGVSWFGVRKQARPGLRIRGLRSLLNDSWPLWVSSVMIYSYYANVDTVILGITRSADEAGLYSAAYRVFLVLNIVGLFAAYAALPSLARKEAAGDDQGATQSLLRTLEVLAAYGVFVLGVSEVAAGKALSVLFGSQFEAAGSTFVLLSIALAWYSVGFPTGYSLLAKQQQGRLLAGAATAGALSLALDLILIPPIGMRGAGVATAVSFVGATLVWLKVRRLFISRLWPILAALALSSIGAVVVALDTSSGPVVGGLTLLALATTVGFYLVRGQEA